MSEVKMIATRESYGNALAELGKEKKIWLYLMRISQRQQKQVFLRKHFRSAILTAGLQRRI